MSEIEKAMKEDMRAFNRSVQAVSECSAGLGAPTYQEARAFVSNWLFESPDRKSGGIAWQHEHCGDAAQMIVDFYRQRITEDKEDGMAFTKKMEKLEQLKKSLYA